MAKTESFNPADGTLIGSVETIAGKDVQPIVDEVAEVQPFWAQLSLEDRARYFDRVRELLVDEMDDVARLLTAEQGKPLTESYSMEVVPTLDVLAWCAEHGPEILDDEPIDMGKAIFATKDARFTYEPLGVVGVISPWNYPWSIPFDQVAMCLMAGNGVVLKPAPLTPLLGERIVELFEKAGLPKGLVRVVHGDAEVGQAMCESSLAKIFFTGSVAAGRAVGETCAREMKGSVLELGGKDAAIVCADADLPNAISGVVWGGFANAGQTCSGIERVYVVEEVAERFIAGVIRETKRLQVGDPTGFENEIGPMSSQDQYDIVVGLLDDAVESGAELLCGGPVEIAGLDGKFIAPAVLTGVTHEMRIMREEIFGPVLPIVVVADEAEAVELANDSDFGLGASVWTMDRAKGDRMARRIEAGMVWLNDHVYSHGACQCSWGGVKDSGLGRSHSKFGFYEASTVKLVTWEPSRTRDIWWHPYDATVGEGIRSAAKVLYGNGGQRIGALRDGGAAVAKTLARSLRKGL